MSQTYALAYTHREPQTAFLVTKDLTNLFVEESVVTRRSEVKGTEEFIEAQLRSARKKLETTEAAVQEFVSANFGKLPEHLDASVARLQNLQAQLTTNSEIIAANISRRSHLENEIATLRKSGALLSTTDDGATSADPRERLAQLESALVVLRSQYSEKHPDVRRTQGRIEALKARIAAEEGKSEPGSVSKLEPSAANPTLLRLRRELSEIGIKINGLGQENERLKGTVAKLRGDIEKMPLKEQELLKIKRDYANVKSNYERLLAAREEAGLQASLIKSQKATQFRVIQPPELPILPAGPDRMLILVTGMAISIVVFFLIPIALFFVNSSYRFRDELEDDLDVPVIGIIPSMDSSYTVQTNMRQLGISMGLSLIVLIAGCAVIVFVT
jgi:polysaccharide chain length determinant protein (PEP-CTERM system associated)